MASSFAHEYLGPLLTLDNVSMTFGKEQILRDISVCVRDVVRPGVAQGQVVGFYGRSGIGKSVLCKIIAGLQNPSTGTTRFGEQQDLVHPGAVGFVQQRYPLFNHKTVMDNLMVAAKADSGGKITKDRAMDLADRFRLTPHLTKYPAHLSGGQRQRTAIAQQLLCSENFIILDEPFSGLDIAMIDKTVEIIKEITLLDEHNTVVIVSHDITTTTALSDSLWLMGYEYDAEGVQIPGATIQQRHMYNLVDMDLAWHPGIEKTALFGQFVEHIKDEIRKS